MWGIIIIYLAVYAVCGSVWGIVVNKVKKIKATRKIGFGGGSFSDSLR